MADRVELAFLEAARELIPDDGSALLVAVSGGGDSVALLHLLARLAPRRGLRLTVAHLDHGLRRGSRTDATFVRRLAASLELPFVGDRRDVKAERRKGESPEEAARRVRRRFLIETCRSCDGDLIATGHNLDDQAETVLMRFARGAGAAALAGIRRRGPGPFVRPLLGIERLELRSWLDRHELPYRDDPTNDDLRFDRNRVRGLLMPELARQLNPRAARHVVEAAERLRSDAEFLDGESAAWLDRHSRATRAGLLSIDAQALATAPLPIAARAARLLLVRAGADPRRVTARHIEALLRLATSPGPGSLDLPTKLTARKARGRIAIAAGSGSGSVV